MQNERQREVEARLLAMADALGGKQGLDRRRFFQTAAGMAASFVAMNVVYGRLFEVSTAHAATPAMAQERANALKDQFIMDMHTHFLRGDTRIMTFVKMRTRSARPAGINSWRNGSRRSRTSNSTTTRKRYSSTATPRSSAICSLVRNQSCSMSEGAMVLLDWSPPDHLGIGRKSRQFLQRKHLPRSWH